MTERRLLQIKALSGHEFLIFTLVHLANKGIAVLDAWNLPKVRAALRQHVLLFLALSLRNHDDGFVAAGVRDERGADPHVAGGASEDHAAWLKRARNFYALNNLPRGA